MKRIILITTLIILVAGSILGIGYFLLPSFCDDIQYGKFISPDGRHEIKYYERGCGATTPFVENIELDGKTILRTVPGVYSINWVNNNQVKITSATSTTYLKIYKILDKYGTISIVFDDRIQKGTIVNK